MFDRLLHATIFPCILFLVCISAFSACNIQKRIPDEDYLVRKVNIDLQTPLNLSEKNILKEELFSISQPKVNTRFFGIPYRLHFYNTKVAQYDKQHLPPVTNTLQEQPSLLDTNQVNVANQQLQTFLINKGFFDAQVNTQIGYNVKRQRATVNYDIITGRRHLINSSLFVNGYPEIENFITALKKQSLLRTEAPYSHELVGRERMRITNELRNKGFYYFGANNLAFELDTNQVKHINQHQDAKHLDVEVIFQHTKDSIELEQYHFNKVVVFYNFDEVKSLEDQLPIRKFENDILFQANDEYVSSQIVDKKIFIRPGNLFSQQEYDKTLLLLNDLGVFKYVRIQIQPEVGTKKLNAYILLAPSKQYDVSTNLEVSGGDIYVLGSAANVSFTNNNFLHGANKFTATASYGLELSQDKQQSGGFFNQLYLFSQNSGINFNLTFPKFLLPINQRRWSRNTLPNTSLDLGYNNLRRSEYFTLNSINASIGYKWFETKTTQWTVKPIFMNILHLSNISPTFQARMDSIPAIRNSYQETFIEGEGLEFIINREGINPYKYAWVKLGFEESGLLMNGIKKLYDIGNPNNNMRFSEYLRFDFDTRQYFTNSKSKLALRFYGGVGIPYGNSEVLPYIKQYFVGGAYSIRGWRPRALGPGSYYNQQLNQSRDRLFIDQAGDIKLEVNAEYRFPIIDLFAGAIKVNGAGFIDAGNIWYMKNTAELPGAAFQFRNLYNDLAASYGAGLRFDLGGFLVLRLDYAIQAKLPYQPENNGWIINKTNLGNETWRKEHTNLNIAIGYPF